MKPREDPGVGALEAAEKGRKWVTSIALRTEGPWDQVGRDAHTHYKL